MKKKTINTIEDVDKQLVKLLKKEHRLPAERRHVDIEDNILWLNRNAHVYSLYNKTKIQTLLLRRKKLARIRDIPKVEKISEEVQAKRDNLFRRMEKHQQKHQQKKKELFPDMADEGPQVEVKK